MDYAIGIDIGTSNTKVGLFEYPSARLVRMESFPTPQYPLKTGGNFNMAKLIDLLYEAIHTVAGADGKRVLVISIASVGGSGVFVHNFGSYSSTVPVWYDKRGAEHIDSIWQNGWAEEYFRITGLAPHPHHALGHILNHRDNRAVLEKATWMPLADFVAWTLAGRKGMDESLASRTLCLDITSNRISDRILGDFDIPSSLFPALSESGQTRGSLSLGMAAELGLAKGCEVCVAGHDHMAGSIAAGISGPGQVLNSTGTSEGVLVLGEAPDLSHEAFLAQVSNGRHVLPGLFSRYASHSAAGFSFEWLAGVIGMTSDELFARGDALLGRYLRRGVTGREAVFVPHLRGSGPPRRDASARGAFVGLDAATTQDDLVKGAYLGVCLELRRAFECVGASGTQEMRVVGPAARSPFWMQLKADVLGVRMLACDVREAVMTGAAALAAIKRGETPEVGGVVASFEPDPARHAALDDLYDNVYLPLCGALSAIS